MAVLPPPVREVRDTQYWVTQFCKHKPPAFRGKLDSAEDWLMRLDKIFEVLECPENKKAQLAIYKLEGDADRWWRNTAATLRTRYCPITWEKFQEKFNEQYFPPSVQMTKESEFLHIRQGQEESFDDYFARFTNLSRYSSHLRRNDDESSMANILIYGLNYDIRERLVSHQFSELIQAVEACRRIERNLRELRKTRVFNSNGPNRGGFNRNNPSQKRKASWGNFRGGNKRPFQPRQQNFPRMQTSQACPKCRRYHQGTNCEGRLVCYKCQKPGHISVNCPQKALEARPQNPGRVFALTNEEARKSPEMIQGTISLNGNLLQALYDSGASHSFISYDCAQRLGMPAYRLPYDLIVATPLGIKSLASDACLNCVAGVNGRNSNIDLIRLPLHGIDVILGLDWLTANNAIIDCGSKKILFSPPHGKVKVDASLNFLSIAEAESCMKQGCQAYMVFFSVKAEVEPSLEDIPVVNEFPDVFPDDLTELPPEREVEFTIDLMPGTGSISKAPYRMAPNEMQELKKQLEELLEKGFI